MTTGQIYWGAVPFVVIQCIMVGLVIMFPQMVMHYKGALDDRSEQGQDRDSADRPRRRSTSARRRSSSDRAKQKDPGAVAPGFFCSTTIEARSAPGVRAMKVS